MEESKKLAALFELGIPVTILARICNCGEASIHNYIKGRSLPSGNKQIIIREGLDKLLKQIKEIIEE